MATPLGHSLAGYAVYGFSNREDGPGRHGLVLLCILMANAPDLDFLFGLVRGRPALYHQGITHSLGVALLVNAAAAGICRLRGASFSPTFMLSFLSYTTHLFIDLLAPDGRPPYGVPLLWPISSEYFISPVPLFRGVHHAASASASFQEWIHGILSLYNLGSMAIEVVLLGPFAFVAYRYRMRQSRRRARL